MAAIFFLSSLPGHHVGPSGPVWRLVSNALHIPLFAGLGFCVAMTLSNWQWPMRAGTTLAIGLAYAVFDEWPQGFVPARSASLADVMLDAAGIALAVGVLWCMSRRQAALPGGLAP